MRAFSLSKYSTALSPDAAEELSLLDRWCQLMTKLHGVQVPVFGAKPINQAEVNAELKSVVAKLGYDPIGKQRPARPRGRAKDASLPSPLPGIGTKLRSCLDETYEVLGYAYQATSASPNMILYRDADGRTVARSLVHLFAGSLPTGEPFVTWADDPRGLKPAEEAPTKVRRSRRSTADSDPRYQDPDKGYNIHSGPRGRGAY